MAICNPNMAMAYRISQPTKLRSVYSPPRHCLVCVKRDKVQAAVKSRTWCPT